MGQSDELTAQEISDSLDLIQELTEGKEVPRDKYPEYNEPYVRELLELSGIDPTKFQYGEGNVAIIRVEGGLTRNSAAPPTKRSNTSQAESSSSTPVNQEKIPLVGKDTPPNDHAVIDKAENYSQEQEECAVDANDPKHANYAMPDFEGEDIQKYLDKEMRGKPQAEGYSSLRKEILSLREELQQESMENGGIEFELTSKYPRLLELYELHNNFLENDPEYKSWFNANEDALTKKMLHQHKPQKFMDIVDKAISIDCNIQGSPDRSIIKEEMEELYQELVKEHGEYKEPETIISAIDEAMFGDGSDRPKTPPPAPIP